MKKTMFLSSLALAAALVVGCDEGSGTPASTGSPAQNEPGSASATAAKAVQDSGAAVASAAGDLLKDPKAAFEKLQGLIDAKNFPDAESLYNQLVALKDKLPAEWSSKLDGIKAAIDAGKKAMGGH